jgi:N6-adenosine-specific RNA methylase IME4
VVAAAEAEPERFGMLVEQMDKTGKVDAAHKTLKVARARDDYQARREQGGTVSDLVALAASGFRGAVIYADPPWQWEPWSRETGMDRAADNHYKTMTIDEIKTFGARYVLPLAANDCTLLMWATWPLMPNWISVLSAWGFTFKTCGFLWAKQNEFGVGWHVGNGYHTRSNTEPCLLATRGAPLRLGNVEQLIVASVRAHSEKPDEVYDRIERLVAGPYLELFARKARPGWQTWGDEVPPPPLPAPGTPDSEFRYVPHESVEQFAAAGWTATEGLTGTHHGGYAVLMQRPAPQTDYPEIPDSLRRT